MTPREAGRSLAISAISAIIAALGCHAAPPAGPLAVQRTPLTTAGALVAAVEQAGTLYLFAPERATIEHAGALVARIPAPDGAWAEAGTMPALDEPGTWVVARTAKGSVWRITTTGELEPIHDLLKLAPHVRSLAAAGGTLGLTLDDGVAVLQHRDQLERFAGDNLGEIIAGAGRVAIRRGPVVDVWDLAARRQARLTVPTAIAAGFTAPATGRGRLIVATPEALFIEAPASPAGALHRLTSAAVNTGCVLAQRADRRERATSRSRAALSRATWPPERATWARPRSSGETCPALTRSATASKSCRSSLNPLSASSTRRWAASTSVKAFAVATSTSKRLAS
ncbi:MAG TPA: hypothetical protein VGC09_18865, partial [Rhodopila sp.]